MCTLILLMLPFMERDAVAVKNLSISQLTIPKSTVMAVVPDTINAQEQGIAVNDTFKDSICISDVTDLYGWQIYMDFNYQVLDVYTVRKGPFLESGGGSASFSWADDYTPPHLSAFAILLNQTMPTANGSGTLCYIVWKVIKGGENSSFDLCRQDQVSGTYLINPQGIHIPFTIADGYFKGPPVGIEENSKPNPVHNFMCGTKLEIYPNPFIKETVIKIEVQSEERGARSDSSSIPNPQFSILIYDLTGRLVKSFQQTQRLNNSINSMTQVWDGTDESGNRLPSGIYFCRLQVEENTVTKQLLMLK